MNKLRQHLTTLVLGEWEDQTPGTDAELMAEIAATIGDSDKQQELGLHALLLINTELMATVGSNLVVRQAQGQPGADGAH